jgi:hypothetical protein
MLLSRMLELLQKGQRWAGALLTSCMLLLLLYDDLRRLNLIQDGGCGAGGCLRCGGPGPRRRGGWGVGRRRNSGGSAALLALRSNGEERCVNATGLERMIFEV